ncbi:MAG: hypothetical protein UV63_C0051G0001, partial [Microgenomates group bacterium GW2011_GWC1_43_11]
MHRCEHLRNGNCSAIHTIFHREGGEVLTFVPSFGIPKSWADEGTLRTHWSARCVATNDFAAQSRCSDFKALIDEEGIHRTLFEIDTNKKPIEVEKENIRLFIASLNSLLPLQNDNEVKELSDIVNKKI